MSKFTFHGNGGLANGGVLYDVTHVPSTKILGIVGKRDHSWSAFVNGTEESGYPTRNAAAERLLLVSVVNPVAWSALPADPFEGVSA